ncbi:unnamed protein product [Ectocarpus sp. 4 AP-2014]
MEETRISGDNNPGAGGTAADPSSPFAPYAAGCAPSSRDPGAATDNGEEEIAHLIKKCEWCATTKAKLRQCFMKAHAQVLRTVRVSRDGEHFVCLATGKVFLRKSQEFKKFYMRLKPGTRIMAWKASGSSSSSELQISEVPWADLAGLSSIALAAGTVLERPSPARPVASWLCVPGASNVGEETVPARGSGRAPRGPPDHGDGEDDDHSRRVVRPGWVWIQEDDDEDEDGNGGGGGGDGGRGGAVAAERAGAGAAEENGCEREAAAAAAAGAAPSSSTKRKRSSAGGSREEGGAGGGAAAAKRRKSRRSGAGVRVSPVGSGGRLGKDSSAGENGEARGSSEGPPSMSDLATKDEVQQALAWKLRACDERESELNGVIARANAALEENNDRRKAAVAESERQLLSIIAQREAKAAYWEKLAAQARAANTSDRLSLLARKEQSGSEAAGTGTTATADAGGARAKGTHGAAVAAAARASESAGPQHQAARLSPSAQLSQAAQVATVSGLSWSIGAMQAARVVQARAAGQAASEARAAAAVQATPGGKATVVVQPTQQQPAPSAQQVTSAEEAAPPSAEASPFSQHDSSHEAEVEQTNEEQQSEIKRRLVLVQAEISRLDKEEADSHRASPTAAADGVVATSAAGAEHPPATLESSSSPVATAAATTTAAVMAPSWEPPLFPSSSNRVAGGVQQQQRRHGQQEERDEGQKEGLGEGAPAGGSAAAAAAAASASAPTRPATRHNGNMNKSGLATNNNSNSLGFGFSQLFRGSG